jgi:hypothetical protein
VRLAGDGEQNARLIDAIRLASRTAGYVAPSIRTESLLPADAALEVERDSGSANVPYGQAGWMTHDGSVTTCFG